MAVTTLSPEKYAPFQTASQAGYAPGLAAQMDNPYTPGHWSQSTIIRLVLGLVVASGITLMLVRTTDLVQTSFLHIDNFWKTQAGFVTWQCLAVAGVFVGAMMAAAGRNQMMTLGILLGVSAGFLTLIFTPADNTITLGLYFAIPAWFTVAGALGAWLGESLWHPQYRKVNRSNSNVTLNQDQQQSGLAPFIRQAVLGMIFANIRWLKVFIAVIVIVSALWFTHDVMNWLLIKLGLTMWVAEVGLQKAWVEFMIKFTVVLLAATFVGGGTTHGIAHGFWIGVIAGVLNLLLHVFVTREDALPVNDILWEVAWVFMLSVAAGGFGALALPPIMYLAKKRHPASLR